jgi:spore coat polysaccharide biosynthesis protein SpsF
MAGPRVITGVFLQGRVGSTRLPGKALLPLAGEPSILRVMRALRPIRAEVYALLTDQESTAAFRPLARAAGFELFTGPALDVLARYCLAAEQYGVTRVVRATGDNPLVSAALANLNLRLHRRRRADLSRLKGAPLGTGVEVVETAALLAANSRSADPCEHEHITTFLLRRPGQYRVCEIDCPRNVFFPEAHVTIDTRADYEYMRRIFTALFRGKPVPATRLVRWLKKNPPPAAL